MSRCQGFNWIIFKFLQYSNENWTKYNNMKMAVPARKNMMDNQVPKNTSSYDRVF